MTALMSSRKLDRAFASWLRQLAYELDWSVEMVARYVGAKEIENRSSAYPRLASLLATHPIDAQEFRRSVSKCWAVSGAQEGARLSQFANSDDAMAIVERLLREFPQDDASAAARIDQFVELACRAGYRHPQTGGRFAASAALLASVLLTASMPDRFVDFRDVRWRAFAVRLSSTFPSQSDPYGLRLVWAGDFAKSISATPTYRNFWQSSPSLWTVAGVCWSAMTPKGMANLLASRRAGIDEPEEYEEGRLRERWHRYRERNPVLVEQAKNRRRRTDPLLRCDVCGFSFVKTYGDRGRDFIEAHHRVPLALLEMGTKTRVEDLDLVCSNCHRMLHHGSDVITSSQLKALLSLQAD